MADVNPPRECNPLCAVGRLSGGRGGGRPWVGATLCTFPAFSLVPKNAMVDNPHGGPHLLTLRSSVSGCVYPNNPPAERESAISTSSLMCCHSPIGPTL